MAKANQGIKWSSLIMGVLLLMLAVVILHSQLKILCYYLVDWTVCIN